MSEINQRKLDHIKIVSDDLEVDRKSNYFDQIQLIHRALPEINLADVDSSCFFLGKKLSFPLIISSMTGGASEELQKINKNLALAAEHCQVGLGVGSQRIIFDNTSARKSFELRSFAPTTLLFANIGAVQLNYDFSAQHCQDAINLLGADAIYLHLNPLQEAIQSEGNTNFANLSAKIQDLCAKLKVPVVIKEVGSGVSVADAKILQKVGVKYLDIAGSGGTSWSRIEHLRKINPENNLGITFQDWGIPTPVAIKQIINAKLGLQLIASGGLRSGIDLLKSLVLGAQVGAIANPFLSLASNSPEAVIAKIEELQAEFRLGMFLLGQKKVADLIANQDLLL